MTKTQTAAWYARRTVALVLAVFSIPLFFFYSDIVARAFQRVVKLEVDPSYTGGRVAATYYDPVGDDRGFGGLTYPKHERFVPGSLDLVQFAVHEPVYDAKWTSPKDYWQLDLAFAGGADDVRNIRIYIDADGDGAGQGGPRDDQAEGVSFDAAHPWDYVVALNGLSGEIVSADGALKIPVNVSALDGGKKLTVRVPLSDTRLHGIYETKETALYVLVGAWSPWGRDGFAPLASRAGSGTGGGAPSAMTPKVYDWLAPEGVSQEKILASWNDDTLEIPSLAPVIFPMHSSKLTTGAVSDSRIAELEKLVAEEASTEQNARETALVSARAAYQSGNGAGGKAASPADAAAESRYALAAFRAGKNDEALAAFNKILAATPDDVVALAYRGSLVSMTARDASPLVAVDIVTRAYADLDRAVALAKTPDEIITVRTNRANVSQSVPETVFGKALQGAEDWLASADANKALAADEGLSHDADIAGDLLNAALCFETAGKPDDAGIWFREAARIANARPAGDGASGSAVSAPGVPAWIRLELAKRGLLAR